jgi:hypothetical protein
LITGCTFCKTGQLVEWVRASFFDHELLDLSTRAFHDFRQLIKNFEWLPQNGCMFQKFFLKDFSVCGPLQIVETGFLSFERTLKIPNFGTLVFKKNAPTVGA